MPLLTIHAPMGKLVASLLLLAIGDALEERDIKHWISAERLPDLVVMVEVPDAQAGSPN